MYLYGNDPAQMLYVIIYGANFRARKFKCQINKKCLYCVQLPCQCVMTNAATVSTRQTQCRSHVLVSCSSLYNIEWEYP